MDPEPDIEAGRKLFAGDCTFLKGVVALDQLPPPDLPEVAFIGRSNVGKSSLVNALTGRKALARTSNTPGRTQELNFFDLGGRLMLVDLPGYGFAKAPKPAVEAWTRLIRQYLQGRPNLTRVNLLIDARHGIKPPDEDFMTMLDRSAVVFQVVLTKADKLKAGQQQRVFEATRKGLEKHVAAYPEQFMTSSEKGTGIPELRAELERLATRSPAGL
jgi:GTP-binding protein